MTRRLVLPFLALALALSACQIRADQRLEFSEDGSGSLSIIIAFDEELRELAESNGESIDSMASDVSGELDSTWSTEPWSDGEFEGVRVARGFGSPEELEQVLAGLQDGESGVQLASVDYVRNGDEIVFTGVMRADEDAQAELEGMDPALIGGFFDIRMTLVLPGDVTSHNADRQEDDGTLVWELSITDQELTMQATSRLGGGLPAWVLAAAGVTGIALIGALVVLLLKRRRAAAPAAVTPPEVEEEAVGQMPAEPAPPLEPVPGDPFA